MSGFILGEKSDQSQVYDDKGERIPTTFVKTSPCYVVDMKWPSKHGYFAVMLGFGQTKNIKKSIQGKVAKAGVKTPLRFFREVRLEGYGDKIKLIDETDKKGITIGEIKLCVGDEVKPTIFFKKGDIVNVSGISKGKGFQGVVKRHHFAGGPRTHGQSDRERGPGSIGQTTTPGRVYKGKRMAGRMGGDRVTLKNLPVVDVKDDGLIIKGLVSGSKGGLLEIVSIK
ncbi:50S ribosomal protein L3 [Candidatus Roizmanbacteria bacterium]|nr:50S ribosomal protein L3 [Candidatus Roizmanbacteria bacterium]